MHFVYQSPNKRGRPSNPLSSLVIENTPHSTKVKSRQQKKVNKLIFIVLSEYKLWGWQRGFACASISCTSTSTSKCTDSCQTDVIAASSFLSWPLLTLNRHLDSQILHTDFIAITTPCFINVPPLACYNFDTRKWILIFLVEILLIK